MARSFGLLSVFSYKDQISVIKTIRLKDGDRKTMNCPFCGGKNKFTIDKFDGKLVWNCYRNSCNVRGSHVDGRSVANAKQYLSGQVTSRKKQSFGSLPEITTKITNVPAAIEYLKSVNSFAAFERGDIAIRYAVKENRVLFYNKDGTGAVGRSLRPVRSKWWTYGDVSGGIHVGEGTHAVLVEDVASACAVSNVSSLVGVALLGTNINMEITKAIQKFNKSTLILDNDASVKAISLVRKLGIDCKLRFTKHDLKYLSIDEIKNLIL